MRYGVKRTWQRVGMVAEGGCTGLQLRWKVQVALSVERGVGRDSEFCTGVKQWDWCLTWYWPNSSALGPSTSHASHATGCTY